MMWINRRCGELGEAHVIYLGREGDIANRKWPMLIVSDYLINQTIGPHIIERMSGGGESRTNWAGRRLFPGMTAWGDPLESDLIGRSVSGWAY